MSKLKLNTIYFGRGFGHTKAMLEGAKHYDGDVIIVAHNQTLAQKLAKECGNHVTGIGLDQTDRLLGLRMPILVDHQALQILLWEREKKIAVLELQNKLLQSMVDWWEVGDGTNIDEYENLVYQFVKTVDK